MKMKSSSKSNFFSGMRLGQYLITFILLERGTTFVSEHNLNLWRVYEALVNNMLPGLQQKPKP